MDLLFGVLGTIVLIAVLVGVLRRRHVDDYLDEYDDEVFDDEEFDDEYPYEPNPRNPTYSHFGVPLVSESPGRPIIPVAPADTLVSLAAKIGAINQANGWRTYTKPDLAWEAQYYVPAVLALVHSEVSEALEDFRHDRRDHFEEEVADTIIRLLDLSDLLGIDIDAAVFAKMERNRTRGYRHGGKRV